MHTRSSLPRFVQHATGRRLRLQSCAKARFSKARAFECEDAYKSLEPAVLGGKKNAVSDEQVKAAQVLERGIEDLPNSQREGTS